MTSNISGLVGIRRIPRDKFEVALCEDVIARALESWSGTSDGYRYYVKLMRRTEGMNAQLASTWTVRYCREPAAFDPYSALDTLRCVELEVWLQEAQHEPGYEVWYRMAPCDCLHIVGPVMNRVEPLTCVRHLIDWGKVG